MGDSSDVTHLLGLWRDGDQAASAAVWEAVHSEVRAVVRGLFSAESRGHTLQPTAVVNEVYLRIARQSIIDFRDRVELIGACASIARKFLVDYARKRRAEKRGGAATRVTLDADLHGVPGPDVDVLELNRALDHLTGYAPREARVVELRYFGGLTIDETAAALEVSVATVKRDWVAAKAALWRELISDSGNGP